MSISQREIKFRAWDNVKDKMYYIGEEEDVSFSFDSNGIIAIDITEDEEEFKTLHHLHYMQYTGLKDKNGKEIYEGDITVDRWGNTDVIRWHKEYGMYYTCPIESINNSDDEVEKLHAFSDLLFKNNVPKEFLVVIGNIYENPSLLEESK